MDLNRKKKLESNIWKYYAYYFLHLFFLFGAILMVYFLDINLSLSKIMFLASLTWIVSLILEVPSGIVSDLYGRKTTLIISSLGYLLWVIFLVISENYLFLLISSVFCGIRLSFKSGSDSALLYDTLKELKRENEHPKISGKAVSFLLVGAAISALLGSTIAELTSIKFTIFLTIFIALCSVFITLSFQEPKSYTENRDKNMFNHLGKSVSICLKNNKLKWLIIFLSTLAALFTIVFSYTQVFLKHYDLNLVYFGGLYFLFLLFAASSSHIYGKIHVIIKDINLFRIIAYSTSIILILISQIKHLFVFILFVLLLELIYGLQEPARQHYINKEIDTKYRATILSLSGLTISLSIVIFQSLSGLLADFLGIFNLFLMMGISTLIVFLISIKKLSKHCL